MWIKKMATVVLVGVMLTGGLVACGGDDDDAATDGVEQDGTVDDGDTADDAGDDAADDAGDDAADDTSEAGSDVAAEHRAQFIEGLVQAGATDEQAECMAAYFEENSEGGFSADTASDTDAQVIEDAKAECGL